MKIAAMAMAMALGELRQRNDVKWTYISLAGDLQAKSPKEICNIITNKFQNFTTPQYNGKEN